MHHAIDQQHEFPDFTTHSVSDSSTHFHVRMANSDLDPHAVARIAEERIITDAIAIIERRFSRSEPLDNPRDSENYLKLKLAGLPYEVFGLLLLDNRHCVIAWVELFRGTIDGCHVHVREVVRTCMEHNAVAVILAHNHPSGLAEPSHADANVTREIRDALKLIGVRLLDHIVIGNQPVSMAARGLF